MKKQTTTDATSRNNSTAKVRAKKSSSWTKHRPLTDSFMFQAMAGTITYLKEVDKSGFNLSQWMLNLGLRPSDSYKYRKGDAGKIVPVFEEMIQAASSVNPKFIGLFFKGIYDQLFLGLKSVDAIEYVLLSEQHQSQDLDADRLAEILDNNLSSREKLILSRRLMSSLNKSAHSNRASSKKKVTFF